MHTVQALKLIGKAVELADAGFVGNCLEEACKGADAADREMVCCVVRAQLHQKGITHATPQQTVQAVRCLAWL